MSVIAGILGGSKDESKILCERMLKDLRPYAGGATSTVTLKAIVFGHALDRDVKVNSSDTQPIYLPDGAVVLADIRMDNRREIAAALGFSADEVLQRPDSWLFAQSWLRWDSDCLERVFGDYAIAVWNPCRSELALARSPFGARPLFYASLKGVTVFSSMPRAIFIVPGFKFQLDEVALAADAVRVPRSGTETIYQNVHRVEPGCIVTFSERGVRTRRFWNPSSEPLSVSIDEAAHLLSGALRGSVSQRLGSSGTIVASQLSAGRDSSAVTVTAAALLAGSKRTLLAFTGAPRSRTQLPYDQNELFDEGELASLTAARHPNIQHHVVRQEHQVPSILFSHLSRLNQFPIPIPSNLPWQLAILDVARASGAKVLLSGQLGNATISLGGPEFLPDLMSEEGVIRWGKELWRSSSGNPFSILRRSARSIVPSSLYGLIAHRKPKFSLARRLLSQEALAAVKGRFGGDIVPIKKSARAELAQALFNFDQAQVLSGAHWGIDIRDPTADRRLAELCLRLPAEALFSGSQQRPAYNSAFGHHLPWEVISACRRGYQGADWFHQFRPEIVDEVLSQAAKTSTGMLFRIPEIRRMLLDWPRQHTANLDIYETFRIGILNVYSTCVFVTSASEHSPSKMSEA